MPNWCDNRLAIAGPPAVVMELVRLVEGVEEQLDFERLLPMPQDLLDRANHNVPADIAYGLPGWYQWRLERWGVKWNASAVTRRGYGRTGRVRYRFFTPYGPPAEFLDHLAALTPEVSMNLTFEVELLGDGRCTWRAGRRVEHQERVPGF